MDILEFIDNNLFHTMISVSSLQHMRFLLYALISIASIVIAFRFIKHSDGTARKVLIYDNLALSFFLLIAIVRGVSAILGVETYGNWLILVAAAIVLVTRTILALFISSYSIEK